ncbi:MAG: hypothetical protein ACD_75C01139G0001 [uncultured bacterium]|nr:MAG: hypothetical protein ACD_75C01139G0001 [uncultured bacterium]
MTEEETGYEARSYSSQFCRSRKYSRARSAAPEMMTADAVIAAIQMPDPHLGRWFSGRSRLQ